MRAVVGLTMMGHQNFLLKNPRTPLYTELKNHSRVGVRAATRICREAMGQNLIDVCEPIPTDVMHGTCISSKEHP